MNCANIWGPSDQCFQLDIPNSKFYKFIEKKQAEMA